MTVSTTASSQTFLGNGATTSFSYNFISDASSDIQVIYTNSSGTQTVLTPSQYTLVVNAPAAGQIWGVGGTVTYPTSGPAIANGTSLTISRVVPLTQQTSISNQGDFSPEVIEEALDTLCLEIQQVSARTGQFRGTWASGNVYNYGDIVQDGTNGANTLSYYFCAIANTSTVWSTNLASGDWVLAIPSVIPTATLPLSIGNGGTGATTAGAALANLGGISLSGNNTFSGNNTYSGSNDFTGGSIAVPTATFGDGTSKAASTSFVASAVAPLAPLASPTFTGTPAAPTKTAGTNSTALATTAYVDRGTSGASMVLLASTTASSSANISFTNIPATYDQYELRLTGVVPATNTANLVMQFSTNNGVSYIGGTAYFTTLVIVECNSGSTTYQSQVGASSFQMTGAIDNSHYGTYGEVTLMLNNTNSAAWTSLLGYSDSSALARPSTLQGTGELSATTGVNAIQLSMSSGNIASGKFALYGIRNA